MAEKEIIVRLSVEGGDQAAKQIDQAAGATKNLATGTKEANTELKTTAKELSATASSADNLNKTTGSLRSQLKNVKDELQKLALAGKANTAEYKKLREEAGKLQDAISDVSDEIRQAGSDTRGLDQTIRVATTAASAFGAVQAATALFGQENEELQKTLVKVTAAISLVQSLQQIQGELLKEDSVFTLAAAKAKTFYAAAVGTSTGALRLFRLALIATGIGAIIALVGAIVVNWDKLSAAIKNSLPNIDGFGKAFERAKEIVRGFFTAYFTAISRFVDVLKTIPDVITAAFSKDDTIAAAVGRSFDAIKKGIEDVVESFDEGVAKQKQITAEGDKYKAIQKQIEAKESEILKARAAGRKEAEITRLEIQKLKLEQSLLTAGSDEYLKKQIEINEATKQLGEIIKKNVAVAQEFSVANLTEKISKLKADIAKLASTDIEGITKLTLDLIDTEKTLELTEKAIANIRLSIEKQIERVSTDLEIKPLSGSLIPSEKATKDATEKFIKAFNDAIKDNPRRPVKTQEEINKELEDERKERIAKAQFIAQKTFDIFRQAQQARLAILNNQLAQGLISEEQYAEKVKEIRRKEAIAAKTEAVFNATLAFSQAVLAALGKGISFAALVAALAGAQLAAIIATPIPKFRRGGEVLEGMIRGNSHERGGVVIEAEGGEYIMNKNVTGKYRPIMEALNAGDLSKVVQLSLPRLPRTSSGGSVRMKDKRLDMMLEEMQYISSYIQQGNRYGKEVAVNTGRSLKTRRTHYV